MSFRSMEFSAVLTFAVCTALMTYLTFGKKRERAMLFPDYYFFAERRLINHTIDKKYVKNLDDCELICYLNDDCVSANFKKDSEQILNNTVFGHLCELNDATHLKYDRDLITDTEYYYRGSKNACDKSSKCLNNATCQSGFTPKGYKCLCPSGFGGEYCQNVDPCHHHINLSDANRRGSYVTPNHPVLCDDQLPEGWYRFVGAAGTKMSTTRVQAYRCGAAWSGWLKGVHPTKKDGLVKRKVCFSNRSSGCKYRKEIFVKNCESYFIYYLYPPSCNSRYCGKD